MYYSQGCMTAKRLKIMFLRMLLLRQASIIPMKKKHKAILFWIDEAHVSPAQGLHAVVYTMSLCWGEQEVD
ncbi:MAG: hypothetical protein AB2615_10375, partial [Candidatus Thiodiazotropha sp.]